MDAQIDDFFNEINEIAPPKQPEPPKVVESVWKECHDELTGYSYYWNCKTDEVTWDPPADFKDQKKNKPTLKNVKKPSGIYIPPKSSELFSGATKKLPQDSVKIYSIGESSVKKDRPKPQKKAPKRPFEKESDSEDERIVLISSYGGDSETDEDEEPIQKKIKTVDDEPSKEENDSYLSEEDDDIDILTKIQKRAQELKELGGELPAGVKEVVENPKLEAEVMKKEKKKDISGFSLVAGYSDSEEENEEIKSVFLPKSEPPPVSHSTLFPITEPIDVKDFIEEPKVEPEKQQISNGEEFHSKAFQRKRRIGVALVNTTKKKEDPIDEERKGLGFDKEASSSPKSDVVYPGFKKGGVMFVKSDVLNPDIPKDKETDCDKVEKVEEEVINKGEVEQMYSTLNEKLVFLNGGRPSISPVQTMVIQAEMLFIAMKDGGLKLSYLKKWLSDTCSELIKLEKEATPAGWLLQWDRSHKRYYYQNLATGISQWEYPQSDSNTFDEAMDISTTPPPTEQVIRMSPPLPPTIRSPTPPPPPIISTDERVVVGSIPIPEQSVQVQPALPTKLSDLGEPLPPGVDLPETASSEGSLPQNQVAQDVDPLNSALDSFYSEVAAIDPQVSSPLLPPSPPNEPIPSETAPVETTTDTSKRKKKSKVKLAPGLSMKKKGVSQLVEKWKSVQQHYND
ncbi:uncharacterized protein [Leptinotarsa decemlineata]|uniref:uncharacterized protein n=1 Tax=Leptinotarsa decemlineata TaxID=7539 RepID=UPI003D309EB2